MHWEPWVVLQTMSRHDRNVGRRARPHCTTTVTMRRQSTQRSGRRPIFVGRRAWRPIRPTRRFSRASIKTQSTPQEKLRKYLRALASFDDARVSCSAQFALIKLTGPIKTQDSSVGLGPDCSAIAGQAPAAWSASHATGLGTVDACAPPADDPRPGLLERFAFALSEPALAQVEIEIDSSLKTRSRRGGKAQ